MKIANNLALFKVLMEEMIRGHISKCTKNMPTYVVLRHLR